MSSDPYNRHVREVNNEAERERIRMKISVLYGIHGGPEMEELREKYMNLINNYETPNNIEAALRQKEYLGNDHGKLKQYGVDMHLVNHYRTQNMDLVYDRCKEYLKLTGSRGTKNYNVNKIKLFKDIPDGVEILIDYVDVTALRTMNIPSEIIYESIYMELPELFEE